jgi:hypothetical protein
MIARMSTGGHEDFHMVGKYLEHGSEQNGNYTEDPSLGLATRPREISSRSLVRESLLQ